MFRESFAIFVFFANVTGCWAWNSVGHRVIAQIAYDNMTPTAREDFTRLNERLNTIYKPADWLKAAVWLDTLRYQDVNWYNPLHYIDIPFSRDGTILPTINPFNAVWAIDNANKLLLNKYANSYDKAIALRILIHVVGDIHQPLHAVTEVSKDLPEGDKGGNLYHLAHNSVGHNLHEYWDRGAGLLKNKKYRKDKQIQRLASEIEEKWPCQRTQNLSVNQWAQESHRIAVNDAYQMPINDEYQKKAQKIVKKQMALAGCRLAAVLSRHSEYWEQSSYR